MTLPEAGQRLLPDSSPTWWEERHREFGLRASGIGTAPPSSG
jgi:hypothetical protein